MSTNTPPFNEKKFVLGLLSILESKPGAEFRFIVEHKFYSIDLDLLDFLPTLKKLSSDIYITTITTIRTPTPIPPLHRRIPMRFGCTRQLACFIRKRVIRINVFCRCDFDLKKQAPRARGHPPKSTNQVTAATHQNC